MIRSHALTALLACTMLCAAPAFAQNRSNVGADIVIQQGETAGNVACVACSVYVHGTVNGNIAAVMGSVTVDGVVNGKVAVVMGNVKVPAGGVIQGDTAIVMGGLQREPGSQVNGKTATVPRGAVLVALAIPVLILVGAIWFLVWIIRRSRRPRYMMPPPGMPPPGMPPPPAY